MVARRIGSRKKSPDGGRSDGRLRTMKCRSEEHRCLKTATETILRRLYLKKRTELKSTSACHNSKVVGALVRLAGQECPCKSLKHVRGACEAFLWLSLLSLHVMCICLSRFLCPEANCIFLNVLAFEVWLCFSVWWFSYCVRSGPGSSQQLLRMQLHVPPLGGLFPSL